MARLIMALLVVSTISVQIFALESDLDSPSDTFARQLKKKKNKKGVKIGSVNPGDGVDIPTIPGIPVLCKQVQQCAAVGGKCVPRGQCPDNMQFEEKLCWIKTGKKPIPQPCGCCFEKKTPPPTKPRPCVQTKKCFKAKGKCVSREDCPDEYKWVPEWCAHKKNPFLTTITGAEAPRCGCCVKPPKPTPSPVTKPPTERKCQQNKMCGKRKGRCLPQSQCPKGFLWEPKYCPQKFPFPLTHLSKPQCGCCSKPKPTRSPVTKPPTGPKKCKQSKMCAKKNGRCLPQDQCPDGFSWEPKFCPQMVSFPFELDSKIPRCGCCSKPKPTRSPVPKPCAQTKMCKKINGKCLSRAQCPKSYVFRPELCVSSPFSSQDCGCCAKPKPVPTPKPTKPTRSPVPSKDCQQSKMCEKFGGKCKKRAECPKDYEFEPKLCKSFNPFQPADQQCGCCRPRKTRAPTPMCRQVKQCAAVQGKCVPRGQCPDGMAFDEKLCWIKTGKRPIPQPCGCCYVKKTPKPTPSPTPKAPCEQTKPCEAAGGKCTDYKICKRLGSSPLISRWKFEPKLCAKVSPIGLPIFDKSCGCCILERKTKRPTLPPTQKPCKQTDQCKKARGKCLKKSVFAELSAAEPNKWRWDQDLCRKPTSDNEEPCGCAIREEPKPCKQTEICVDNNGKCMSREDCKRVNDANDLVRYVFDPKMCALASSDVNKDCGCCRPEKQEPKPCDQTEECKKSNGKCVKKSIFEQLSAAEPNKWRWDIDLCRKPGTDDQEPCGCAIREEPTPPPTEEPKPCEATEVCMKNGGFGNGRCMSREDCARVDDMNEFVAYVFDPKMCALSSSDVNKDCGCCRPKEQEPTPCEQTEECAKVNGKCMSTEDFAIVSAGEPNKWKYVPELCQKAGANQETCGCAIPEEPTPPPTEEPKPCETTEVCEDHDGKCMSREDCKRVNDSNDLMPYVFDPDMCASASSDVNKDCGCCRPKKTDELPTKPPTLLSVVRPGTLEKTGLRLANP